MYSVSPMKLSTQTLEFVVLLWSKNADALELLGQPAAVKVAYCMADFMPSSEALRPREQSHQTRKIQQMVEGRVWSAETGRSAEGASNPGLVYPEHIARKTKAAPPSPTRSRPPAILRMQSVWTAESEVGDGEADNTHLGEQEDDVSTLPSDLDDDVSGHFLRLEGEIVVPPCRPVSYRYTEIGREYSLDLQFSHPLYSHISPTGPGLVAEVPLWYVADRPLRGGPAILNDDPSYLQSLPLKGATLPVGPDAVWWPRTMGKHATTGRGGLAKLGQPFLGLIPPNKSSA
ncbi:hypothetical protein C8F01DRAFT_739501 [Mycena amicta]|nr:hypothetical protein C8F01DRAFT_739501 [Mycena amicta]